MPVLDTILACTVGEKVDICVGLSLPSVLSLALMSLAKQLPYIQAHDALGRLGFSHKNSWSPIFNISGTLAEGKSWRLGSICGARSVGKYSYSKTSFDEWKISMRIAALAEALHIWNSTSFLAQNGSSKTNYLRPVSFLIMQFMQF